MPLFLTFKLIAPHWFVRIFLCFFFDKIIHVNATFVGSCQFSAFIMIHIIKLNTHSASCSVRLDVSMLFFSPPPPSILQRLRPPGRSYCLHSCNNSVANIVKKTPKQSPGCFTRKYHHLCRNKCHFMRQQANWKNTCASVCFHICKIWRW